MTKVETRIKQVANRNFRAFFYCCFHNTFPLLFVPAAPAGRPGISESALALPCGRKDTRFRSDNLAPEPNEGDTIPDAISRASEKDRETVTSEFAASVLSALIRGTDQR